MADYRKKLIEVALPLEAINRESAREKSIRQGHPSTLHLWWARRPLAACRAVLFASIVDDPSSRPTEFPTEADQERERQRLFRLIEELIKWDNSSNAVVLDAARAEIVRATSGRSPTVLDPFCGGGSIPLEAARLGLDTLASDLNPVAVLITKALVELPPLIADRPPVNPEARRTIGANAGWYGAQGLANDVIHYGQWMRDQALRRIGHFYPHVELSNSEAKVIAWLWARTVKSPDPAFADVDIPLVSSFVLSTKKGREAYVDPVVEHDRYQFVVRDGVPPDLERARVGTRAGRAQDFLCVLSGAPVPRTYIREEGKAGRLGVRLMAIVAAGDRRRFYLSPTPSAELAANAAGSDPRVREARETFLSGATPTRAMTTGGVCSAYGLSTWGDLFTPRQLITLTTLSDLVADVREKINQDAADPEYADIVTTYLALGVSRLSDICNAHCTWKPSMNQAIHLFTRQAIPMVWDFAETNPFGDAAGDFVVSIRSIARVIANSPAQAAARVRQLDATTLAPDVGQSLVLTDPPYYDNIGYAELSDFFYVWLRRSLFPVYPDVLSTLLTPKADELVATPYRFAEGQRGADRFFEAGLRSTFDRLRKAQDPALPLAMFYAFKQAEVDAKDATRASTGWDTMLTGLLDAGLAVTGTWPIRSELSNRSVASGTNALASSIVLVCRPRPANAGLATRREFVGALRAELPAALKQLQHGNIAPVDLAQAAIGPGIGIFSRYGKVLEADGQAMTVRTALGLINQALDEILAEQEGDFDAETRFAVTWFEQRGFADGPYGEADVLARAKDTSAGGLEEAGILVSHAGKVRLLRREELLDDWDPVRDGRPTVWEAAHHLARQLEVGGEGSAADLLRRLGGLGETARALAYRLYTTSERKGWVQEALAYNALVVAWPEIARRVAGTPEAEAQQILEI